MKLIKPSYQIIPSNGHTIEGIHKDIEVAARTCYKSEDKITEESSSKFVDMLLKREHYAMFEFGTVYLLIKVNLSCVEESVLKLLKTLSENPYCKINYVEDGDWSSAYITTNYRVVAENPKLGLLKYLTEPTEHHHKRVTVKFTTSIGIVREIIRHRVFSFANESTRYCNYSKDKFKGVTFIIPHWVNLPEGNFEITNVGEYIIGDTKLYSKDLTEPEKDYLYNCMESEGAYHNAIEHNISPQGARDLLPLCTKSELIMCGFTEDWQDFFNKRTSTIAKTGMPHPDLYVLTDSLYEEFKSL